MSLLDTSHKRKSFTLTTVLLSLLLLLMFYVGLTYMDPPEEIGILVNFGTSATGSGSVQPMSPRPEPVSAPSTPPEPVRQAPVEEKQVEKPAASEAAQEKVVTQDQEESIRLAEANRKRRESELAVQKQREEAARLEKARQAEAERIEKARQAELERQRQEQDAKKQALDRMMGGLSGPANGSTGEGDDKGPGDKGSPNGDAYAGSYFGDGSGGGGVGYGLKGRSLLGNQSFEQDCNETGRVVVQIEVDRTGKVIKATPGVRGTTNAAECLLTAARKTALSYRWNADGNAPTRQIGFVVVNFKLGE